MNKIIPRMSHKLSTYIWQAVLIFAFTINTNAYAQTTVSGKVFDQETKAPIPYASIYLENSFTGVEAEADGRFTIELKGGLQGNVIIRSMGYDFTVMTVDDFLKQGSKIYLKPTQFEIKEFDKTAQKALDDPYKIVRKALQLIPQNMADETTELKGIYQQAFQDYETDKVLHKNYTNFSVNLEGIAIPNKKDSISIIKAESTHSFWDSFRYNNDALLPQYQIPDYGTDHLQCLLRMDPVRNYQTPTFDFVKQLDKDFIANHYFYLDSIGVYNNENVYCISVFLLHSIRFKQVNLISGGFQLEEIYNRTLRNGTEYPSNLTLTNLKGYDGRGVSIPIGRLFINTKDLAITYFEYINGFGNDRYKFIAEYVKYKGQYYPSKLYFGNKFIMKTQPDFSAKGSLTQEGLVCLMDNKYYRNTVKRNSNTKEQRQIIDKITKDHTINCVFSSDIVEGKQVYIDKIIAYTKITEEIQDTFEYEDYHKYLHHRLVVFEFPDDSTNHYVQSDYNRYYYPLGDRKFHWNPYRALWCSKYRVRYNKQHNYVGRAKGCDPIFPYVPLPITSTDEYRYILRSPENPKIHDKADLVKGLVDIWP